MKTIVQNGTNISKFIFDNDKRVIMGETQIEIGPAEKLELIVACHSKNDCTVHTDVTPPDDWTGNKYCFDGTSWSENSDYEEPTGE